MSRVDVARADRGQLDELAALAEAAQTDPARYVAYFGDLRAEIAAEIAAIDGWEATTHVAVRDERIVGWLFAETDVELHRAWWWGPVIGDGHPWAETADALYALARADLDGRFDQEELAVDARATTFADFAARHGFRPDPASTLLRITIGPTAPDPRVTELDAADVDATDAVAALHDTLFPATHTTGRQLVDAPSGPRLIARSGQAVIGYIAFELQPGNDGYIDFIGVDPDHGGRGIGAALVASALHALAQHGATSCNLTVRQANALARRLYRRLGFEELRDLQPFRKGFSLP